jgi:PAS domain S-box-containing protein
VAADIGEELDAIRILQELGARLVTEESGRAIHEEVLLAAVRLAAADAGLIQSYDADADELVLLAWRAIPEPMLKRCRKVTRGATSPCARALRSLQRVFVDDSRPAGCDGAERGVAAGFTAAQATPLIGRSGTLMGMLTVFWRARHTPCERELRMADLLARQAADLLERAQVEALRRDFRRRQEFMLKLGDLLRSLDDPEEIRLGCARLLARHLGACRTGFADLAEAHGMPLIPPHFHEEVAALDGRTLTDAESLLIPSLLAGRTLERNDVAKDPELSRADRAAHAALGIGASHYLPLFRSGRPSGFLFVHFPHPRVLTAAERELLDDVAARTRAELDRSRAEQALQNSQSQLQALFDAAPLGVVLMDASLRILAVNPVAARTFGEGPPVVGSHLGDRLPHLWVGADWPKVLERFHHTLATGRHHFVPEWRHIGTPGPVHEWQIHRVPLRDGSHGVVCYFREISAQVRATEDLVASEARYRTLFNSIDEGFCLIEMIFDDAGAPRDYRFIEVNPAFIRHTGLAAVEGRTVREFVPDLEDHWFQAYGKVACTGMSNRFAEYSSPMNRWFDVYAFRVGSPLSRKVGILFTDITERREADERMKRAADLDAFRLTLADALRPLESAEQVQAEAVRLLGMRLRASRVNYVEADSPPDSGFLSIRPGYHAAGVPQLSGRFRAADLGAGLLRDLHAGRAVTVSDVAHDPRLGRAERAAYPAHHVRSFIATPLSKAGRLVALVVVQQTESRCWTDEEVAWVGEAAERTWEAVERARSDQARRDSEQRLRMALESARMAAWDWDVVRDAVRWNDRHFLILGLVPDGREKSAADFIQFVHPADRPGLEDALTRAVASGGAFQHEFRIIRADDGSVRWMCGFGQSVDARGGRSTRMTGVMYDVTQAKTHAEELRRARDELEQRVAERTAELETTLRQLRAEVHSRESMERERRELLERLVQTQEAERSRVARELHDNLGQHMVAVLLRLDTFQRQLSQAGVTEEYNFSGLRETVDGLIKATHRQSWELRPAELDELGLDAAVENYVQRWSEKTGIACVYHPSKEKTAPPPEATIALYRVAQEALTNVARHSGASRAEVRLTQGDRPVLSIRDDGCGFDPAATPRRLGLLGMKERLDIIGGTLCIDSAPGRGTLVVATLP